MLFKKAAMKNLKRSYRKTVCQILCLIEEKQLCKFYFSWLLLQKRLRYRCFTENFPKFFWEILFRGNVFSVKHALCKRKLDVNSAQKSVSTSLLQNNCFEIFHKTHLTLHFLSKVAGLQLFAKKVHHRSWFCVNFAKSFRSAAFYNITGRLILNVTKTNKITSETKKLRENEHTIPTSQVKLIKYRSSHQRCSIKKLSTTAFLQTTFGRLLLQIAKLQCCIL